MSYGKSSGFTAPEVAKRFFLQFKAEHLLFSQQLEGRVHKQQFDYTCLLLNRLLVLYFLQKRHLLDNDPDYLSNRLHNMQQNIGKQCFYHQFLLPLFSRLYASKPLSDAQTRLIGAVPTLMLPLFKISALERTNASLFIPDSAFVHLFTFFDLYNWQIDASAPQGQNELRPDILGYIFEHATDQKQFGAYYTQEDITTYIASNTIVARLFTDVIQYSALGDGIPLNHLLQANPDRYIHAPIRSTSYLVEETEIEYRQRQRYYRYLSTRLRTRPETLQNVDDLVTYNLDLIQLAVDMISLNQNYSFVVRVYLSLSQMLILDPTCGTGAFLFAALTTLAPLYKACLESMQKMKGRDQRETEDRPFSRTGMQDIQTILAQVETHPNLEHFILATIIEHNLYGVELMSAAVETCRLRLSLALLTHGPCGQKQYQALRTNILPGDALLGDTQQHIDTTLSKPLPSLFKQDRQGTRDTVNKSIADEPFHWYKEFPVLVERGGFDVIIGNPPYLEYSRVKQFYSTYASAKKACGNLYAAIIERSLALCHPQQSYLGFIVPISICSGERFTSLRQTLFQAAAALWLANFEIFPCRLFENAFQRVSIVLAARRPSTTATTLQVTRTHRWFAQERAHLLQLLLYTQVASNIKRQTFPKLASPHHEHVIQKMLHRAQGKQIATFLHPQQTRYFVYYQEATNYWTKAACHIPYYKKNGEVTHPSHGRFLFLEEEQVAKIIMALMNSSLFYIWFTTYADGFHLSHALVKAFPVSAPLLASQRLYELACLLEKDIQRHTRLGTHNTKKDSRTQKPGHLIEIEEYQMRYSKNILDEVDKVLAEYYKFTPEELEFIINYDIKYRLSKRRKK